LRVAAIVLAAGASSRMGRNKLLIEVEGETVLDRLLKALIPVAEEIVIVTGHNPKPIEVIAGRHHVRTIFNPDHEKGMTTSFQTGLCAVEADAAFLVLGDQLGLEPELLQRMVQVLERNPETLIVSPEYEGKRGHPTLFRKAVFSEFLKMGSEEILRDIVLRHEKEHGTVPGSRWTTIDFDTPADFVKAAELWKTKPVRSSSV
jgi:molybdenum cofactor cytidylyltransferase